MTASGLVSLDTISPVSLQSGCEVQVAQSFPSPIPIRRSSSQASTQSLKRSATMKMRTFVAGIVSLAVGVGGGLTASAAQGSDDLSAIAAACGGAYSGSSDTGQAAMAA